MKHKVTWRLGNVRSGHAGETRTQQVKTKADNFERKPSGHKKRARWVMPVINHRRPSYRHHCPSSPWHAGRCWGLLPHRHPGFDCCHVRLCQPEWSVWFPLPAWAWLTTWTWSCSSAVCIFTVSTDEPAFFFLLCRFFQAEFEIEYIPSPTQLKRRLKSFRLSWWCGMCNMFASEW